MLHGLEHDVHGGPDERERRDDVRPTRQRLVEEADRVPPRPVHLALQTRRRLRPRELLQQGVYGPGVPELVLGYRGARRRRFEQWPGVGPLGDAAAQEILVVAYDRNQVDQRRQGVVVVDEELALRPPPRRDRLPALGTFAHASTPTSVSSSRSAQ